MSVTYDQPETAAPEEIAERSARTSEPDLWTLHRSIAELVEQASRNDGEPQGLVDFLGALINSQLLICFQENSPGQLQPRAWFPRTGCTAPRSLFEALGNQAALACSHDRVQVAPLAATPWTLVAVPVTFSAKARGALAAGLAIEGADLEPFVAAMQLVGGLLTSISQGRTERVDPVAFRRACEALELLAAVGSATDRDAAQVVLVRGIQKHANCRHAALALADENRQRFRLTAISDCPGFSTASPLATALQGVLDAFASQGVMVVWPSQNSLSQAEAARCRAASDAAGGGTIAVLPLATPDNPPWAVLLLCGLPQEAEALGVRQLLEVAGVPLERLLRGQATASAGALRRVLRRPAVWCLPLVLFTLLLVSWPYRVKCDCRVEPVVRRYVVAPFDGILETSLVRPGDFVRRGAVLARMDQRELRIEISAVEAEYERARKSRDSNLAAGKVGAAQIDGLEMDRLEQRLRLLNGRMADLEIRAPADGIVITGDLERSQGAPVAIGKTLYEIAPLGRMVAELSIPESDVAYIAAGQAVSIRLDAFPGTWIDGTIMRVDPRSEIRDDRNVFVADVELPTGLLPFRPGMRGTASIETPSQRLGWILLHRGWYRVRGWLGL